MRSFDNLFGKADRNEFQGPDDAVAGPFAKVQVVGKAVDGDTRRSNLEEEMMQKAANWLFSSVLLLMGCGLLGLGARLLALGGSPYYVLAGAAIFASAILVIRRNPAALYVYGAFFVVTLLWAIWEAGLDGWALAPRLAMPTVLGLWMLTPWLRRHIGRTSHFTGQKVLFGSVALCLVTSVASVFALDRIAEPARFDAAVVSPGSPGADWTVYGGDSTGRKYSPLAQITPANVANLKEAWTYHVGPAPKGISARLEVTPIKIGPRLYLCTGYNDVVALEPDTGRELWRFRAKLDPRRVYGGVCRGVTYHRIEGAEGPCSERIFTATMDGRLIALDATTGQPCHAFGKDGSVDLLVGMGKVSGGYYAVTSPPHIAGGRVVVGGRILDGQHVREPPGAIRAYDAVTGKFSWAFDPGRPDYHGMPAPGETYTLGTPNSWGPLSSDDALGLVYIPTGNATPDYYGGHRSALDDKYSSAVVALDVTSGAPRWVFQTTHHDVWDYDNGAQPTLVDLPTGEPALLQATKRGEIFLLDRRTGKPLAEVTERRAPGDAVPGERPAPTQPYSTGFPSLAGDPPTEKRMWGLTPVDQAVCRIRFRQARFDGSLTPVGVDRPTIVWPGYLGGVNWGGVSVDPERQIVIINTNHVSNYNRLMPRAEGDRRGLKPFAAGSKAQAHGAVAQAGTPYAADVTAFLSPLMVPCEQPPYGMLTAVDLRTRRVLWSRRPGTARDSGPFGIAAMLPIPLGTPNLGGTMTTRSGLVFMAATQEKYLRAYDIRTGRELWKARLPAGGHAVPATYRSQTSGRQFVVIAAGGHPGMMSGESDAIVAYALARPSRGREPRDRQRGQREKGQ